MKDAGCDTIGTLRGKGGESVSRALLFFFFAVAVIEKTKIKMARHLSAGACHDDDDDPLAPWHWIDRWMYPRWF